MLPAAVPHVAVTPAIMPASVYSESMQMDNVGGTKGGLGTFALGGVLALAAAWFFIDSVRVTSYGRGIVSGAFGGGTGSAGIVFFPIFVAIVALFYDATKRWAWGLLALGGAIVVVEILSKLSFWFNLKLSHFMIMLITFAAGLGLMLKSLKEIPTPPDSDSPGVNP